MPPKKYLETLSNKHLRMMLEDCSKHKASVLMQMHMEVITSILVARSADLYNDLGALENSELICWWRSLNNSIRSRSKAVGTKNHTNLCRVEREIERRGLSF